MLQQKAIHQVYCSLCVSADCRREYHQTGLVAIVAHGHQGAHQVHTGVLETCAVLWYVENIL